MPYFAWRGIHITGKVCKGRIFARSSEELDTLLFKRDIALLNGSQTQSSFMVSKTISAAQRTLFLRQLATLLSAGILLPDALRVVAEQLDNPRMQEIVHQIADRVHNGVPLSEALRSAPLAFDSLVIQMVHVGQEAGMLGCSLSMICDHNESMEIFKKKVRAAAIMPIVTLLFFGFIASLIFIVIIPKFAVLFHSMRQELPAVTRIMLNISNALFGWRAYLFLGLVGVAGLLIRAYCMTAPGKRIIDVLVLRLPIIGDGIKQRTFFALFHAVAMMQEGGMPLLAALGVARQTISNEQLHDYILYVERDIAAGSSMSQAMMQLADPVFGPDIIAMIRVGEESGCLSGMLQRVAGMYQERMHRTLTLLTTFLSPLLMIILGLLISALIFAVYMPIFSLAQVIG